MTEEFLEVVIYALAFLIFVVGMFAVFGWLADQLERMFP